VSLSSASWQIHINISSISTSVDLLLLLLLLLRRMVISCTGVSTFVSEFVKRKLAEQNRKPGGKKKKGAAAAAAPAAAPVASGVSAASVGLMSSGACLICLFQINRMS
jgi:hypothetical protein